MAISADGSTVVGFGPSNGSSDLAFRWTLAGGMEVLSGGAAFAVSADGSIVAGRSGSFAVRWVGSSMQDLRVAPELNTSAVGAGESGDGSVIVGSAGINQAFRWTATVGAQWLAIPISATNSAANGVSADGNMVAGLIRVGGHDHAFRWIIGSPGLDIGVLAGGTASVATTISASGMAMAGYGDNLVSSARAFRWSAAQGMIDLGILPGSSQSFAFGIGADGSAVVGYTVLGSTERAFLWIPAFGMLDLNDYLPQLGVDLSDWQLTRAQAISADGTAIVGYGLFQGLTLHGWVVRGLNLGFCPSVLVGPRPALACPAGSALFSVNAAGAASPLSYQWQIESTPGVWQTLANDPAPLPCGGGSSAYVAPAGSPSVTLAVRPCPGQVGAPQSFGVRCVVSNQCGAAITTPVYYTVCPVDFDCSGSLTVQDIFAYLNAWFAGDPRADFNGGGLSVPDIFDFLNAWFAGC
jgi:uncharacterized membrane protein